ncbi:MAG: WD40 repeat domain-containing protein [Gemmataceae bacterium]
MTRTLPLALALASATAVAPTTARPPLADPAVHVLDFPRHDVLGVRHVWFSPGGRLVAVTGGRWLGDVYEPSFTLWESATGRHLWTLRGADADASGFCFSPDGKHLACASDERGTVVVRDVARGAEVRRYTPAVSACACYSPDGKYLVTYCLYRPSRRVGLALLDPANGRVVYEPVLGKDERLRWFTFAADGRMIVVTDSTALRTWHPHRGAETVAQMDLPLHDVSGPDQAGTQLLRWGTETLKTIDVATGRTRLMFGREGEACGNAHLTADGAEVVSATVDGRVIAWDSTTGTPRTVIQTHAGPKDRIALVSPYLVQGRFIVQRTTPDERRGSGETRLCVFTRDGRLVREDRNLTDLVFDSTRRWVAVRTDSPAAPGRPSRPTVTIRDAAEWLAGR